MVEIKINERGLQRQFLRYEKAIGDFRPFFDNEGRDILQAEFHRAFETRGFGQWAPLRERTLANKRRLGQPADPLVATGELRRSLTSLEGIRRTRFTLTFQSPVPYSIYHELGTQRMPARPVFRTVVEDGRRKFAVGLRRYLQRRFV